MYLKGAKFLAVEIDVELDVGISRGFVGSVFARSVLNEDLQSLPHHGPALIGGSLSRIIWPMGRSIWERRRT